MFSLLDTFRMDGFPLLGFVVCIWLASSLVFAHLRIRKARGLVQDRNLQLDPKQPLPVKKKGPVDYVDVFPPLQDDALQSSSTAPKNGAIPAVTDLATISRPILKLTSDYRCADPSEYVFSGYSVDYVRRLGDFPDYAQLSGVPLPSPILDFDIDKAVPRPYRPFRWAYHQTMSLTKLESDFWIELESTYKGRIRQRQNLYAKHGTDVLQALPGSELACKELMEMVIQFICARYPNQFEMKGSTLVNHILNTECNVKETEPLVVLLNNVPEDFALTLRDETTGRYILRAGVICSSVGWNLGEKMGLGLPEIHRVVPDYKEKMEFSMDRFFTKMPTSGPIQRGSWGLEMGQPLYLAPGSQEMAQRQVQDESLQAKDVFLRIDWQTLRRLPLSGAIVFNFKALFTPMTEFEDEPYIPSIILKVLNEGKENLLRYKGTWHVEHVVKPALAEYERRQIEKGMIERDWKHKTLDENPFFPGWERKWHVN